MFRTMRRFKQELQKEDCIKLLISEKRGALSVNGDEGYPYTLPINYYYNEDDGKIYFHGARAGHKIDAIKANGKVCFTVWDSGYRNEGEWFYHVNSVIVMGKATLVTDEKLIYEMSKSIGLKYFPATEDVNVEIEKYLKNVQIIELTPEHISGKHVREK